MGLAAPLAGAGTYETVVLSGTPAPGTEAGTTFWFFQSPLINNAGDLSFSAWLQGPGTVSGVNDSGSWTVSSEGLTFVARNGDPAVGTEAGVVYGPVTDPLMNESGQYWYSSTLSGPGVTTENNNAYWTNRGGSLELLLREGDAAFGTPMGVVYSSPNQRYFNDAGQFAFRSNLAGPGVSSTNNQGVWTEVGGSLSLLARTGDAAPGTEPGVVFSAPGLSLAGMNNQGRVVLHGFLAGPGIDTTNNTGIWSDIDGALALMVRAGDAAPGFGPGVSFGNLVASSGFWMNDAGQFVFRATLTGTGVDNTNSYSIWVGSDDELRSVIRFGDPIPGVATGMTFGSVSNLKINHLGQVAFQGYLSGTGIDLSNDGGLWFEQDGELQLMARDGDQAAGTDPGTLYRAITGYILNGNGQIAFRSVLTGEGVDETNDRTIYATDTDGKLFLVAREGELFDVDDDPLTEDLRTIRLVSFGADGSSTVGHPSSFNDHGQLAISLGFTDGSWGIFIAETVARLDGDINGDGFVGVQDLDILLANWGDAVGMRAASSGDLSGDGLVGEADLDLLIGAWGSGTAPDADLPEPGSLALLAAGWLMVSRRRRWGRCA